MERVECRYVIYGRETGESGTRHLQGYIEFESAKPLGGVRKILPKAHWEPRRGTPQEAAEYCRKEGDWTERGELPKQGRRSDLEEAAALALDVSVPLESIAKDRPGTYVRYHKGLAALRSTQLTDRVNPPTVTWLWGATGVGKTKQATSIGSFYIKDATKWWDGYTQQNTIVIDDFDGTWPFRDLLRLLDRYPYQGQTKGGYVKINSENIFITCDRPPEYIWEGRELSQILRRITTCTEVRAQK